MKRLFLRIALTVPILTGLLIMTGQQAGGQVDTLKNPDQFLYSDFTIARIATSVGKDLKFLANYNIVTEMIVFLQRGQIYDLSDYHNVDTIYFKDAIYIPGEKVFYELKVQGPVSLLIRHRGTIQSPPKPAAYGGTSEVSASNNISYLQMGSSIYRLQNDTALIIKQDDEYLIGKGEEISPFRNQQQFIALMPEIKNELKTWFRENKVHFDRVADLVKLVTFCNTIKK